MTPAGLKGRQDLPEAEWLGSIIKQVDFAFPMCLHGPSDQGQDSGFSGGYEGLLAFW